MTVISVDRDPVARTLTIVGEFDKPAERVWQVWADPRQLERWWGPPTYPATVVDHDLSEGGRVTYYMTGPDGEKLHAWWRIVSVDPPHSLAFEEGNADDSGPDNNPPTTSIKVRIVETPEKTTMTITCRFAPTADNEVPGAGTERGMRLAVAQIDAILATTTVFGPYDAESLIHGLTSGSHEQRASSAWELGLHDGDAVIDALTSRLAEQNEDTVVLMEVVAALDRIRSWRSREALLLFGSRTDPATVHEERCRLHALRAVARLDRETVA